MKFKDWFKYFKKQPEPQPDDFNQQFDAWLAGKLYKGSQEVYTLAVKGKKGIATIQGTFEFHQKWEQAVARKREVQSDNPRVEIEIRKIVFDYKYI